MSTTVDFEISLIVSGKPLNPPEKGYIRQQIKDFVEKLSEDGMSKVLYKDKWDRNAGVPDFRGDEESQKELKALRFSVREDLNIAKLRLICKRRNIQPLVVFNATGGTVKLYKGGRMKFSEPFIDDGDSFSEDLASVVVKAIQIACSYPEVQG